jgi:hypothetical protein
LYRAIQSDIASNTSISVSFQPIEASLAFELKDKGKLDPLPPFAAIVGDIRSKSRMVEAKLRELMLRQSMLQKKHLSLCHHSTASGEMRP